MTGAAGMWRTTERQLLKRLQLKESWVIFFILGVVMLNFPFLNIFNRSVTFLGFPLLYLYFTLGWAISIGVIYLFVTAAGLDLHDKDDEEEEMP